MHAGGSLVHNGAANGSLHEGCILNFEEGPAGPGLLSRSRAFLHGKVFAQASPLRWKVDGWKILAVHRE